MGHHAHSAPAKFKLSFSPLYDVELKCEPEGDDIAVLPQKYGGKPINEALRVLHRMSEKSNQRIPCDPYLGWSVVDGRLEEEHGKKYYGIFGHKFVKDNHVVWYVNESEASHVGYETPCFIAFDAESLKSLQKDVGGDIEDDTTVMSWW